MTLLADKNETFLDWQVTLAELLAEAVDGNLGLFRAEFAGHKTTLIASLRTHPDGAVSMWPLLIFVEPGMVDALSTPAGKFSVGSTADAEAEIARMRAERVAAEAEDLAIFRQFLERKA